MRNISIGLGFLSLFAAACSEEAPSATVDSGTDAPVAADVGVDSPIVVDAGSDAGSKFALSFEGRVGAEAFSCSKTYAGLGTTTATVEPLDFRFYVHDVRFVRADKSEAKVQLDQDGTWQLDDIALIDFEDKTGTCANGTAPTNTSVKGTVAPGTYTGVKFKLGLPASRNHADVSTAPSPLNLSALFWSWQSGYKFLRVDSRLAIGDGGVPDGGVPVFNLHLGSSGCTGDPDGGTTVCTNLNLAEVALDLNPQSDTIVVDYAAVIAGNDLKTNAGGAPGCMSGTTDPECPAVFTRLGLDLATGNPAAGQTFFKKK